MALKQSPMKWQARASILALATAAPLAVLNTAARADDNWTGVYVGVGGGVGMANNALDLSNGPLLPAPAFNVGLDGLGGTGGAFTLGLGADYRVNASILVGAFFDYDWMNVDTDIGGSITGLGSAKASFGFDNMWSLGGRLGYLVSEKTMFFASAGYARANVSDLTFSVPGLGSGSLASSGALDGYFIGGGAEIKITDSVTLKGEYRYNDFSPEGVTLLPGTALAPLVNGLVKTTLDPTVQTAKLTLNYRFGAGRDASKDYEPAEPVSTKSWTGIYLGIGGGVGVANHELDISNGPGVSLPFGVTLDGLGGDGGLLTLGAGADYQINRNVVVGAFFDYDHMNLDTGINGAAAGLGAATAKFDLNSMWAIGARIGYLPTPDTLLFVDAGYTHADISDMVFSVTGLGSGVLASAGDVGGYFVGGGAEIRLSDALSLKGEYRYSDFGATDVTLLPGTLPLINQLVSTSLDTTVQTGKVSLNYRFNWGGDDAIPLK